MKPWIRTPTGALLSLEHVAIIEPQPCGKEILMLARLGRIELHISVGAESQNPQAIQQLVQQALDQLGTPAEVLLGVFASEEKAVVFQQELEALIESSGASILEVASVNQAKALRPAARTSRHQNVLGSGKSSFRGRRS